ADVPRVVDPVLRASSGASLFDGSPEDLIALAQGAVLTPNLPEAEALGDGLLEKGAHAVLLKGGHSGADPVIDRLITREGEEEFRAPRIPARARGTGCRLASAIAAHLARGSSLRDAILAGREYVRRYLTES